MKVYGQQQCYYHKAIAHPASYSGEQCGVSLLWSTATKPHGYGAEEYKPMTLRGEERYSFPKECYGSYKPAGLVQMDCTADELQLSHVQA